MAATASSDGRVSILSHQSDNSWVVEYIQDNPLGVNAVSWAPHGAYYDESSEAAHQVEYPRLVTGGCDNRIRFWAQQETGQWQEDTTGTLSKELSHSDWVRDVAWAPSLLPNVNLVASCSEDRTVIIWRQDGYHAEWKPTLLHTFDSPVWRVSWSVTGHMLAVSSGDNDVTLWKAGIDSVWRQMEHFEVTEQSG
jgi:protein transport protein SEC13